MRKLILVVCLCLLSQFMPALAAGGTVSVKPIDKQVLVGDILKVDIRGAALSDLFSVKFEVVYENRIISFKEAELGSLCANDPKPIINYTPKKNGDKTRIIVGISYTKKSDKFAESGTFFTLKFTAVDASKSSPITIENLEGRNARFDVVQLSAENSEVKVIALPTKPILTIDPKELDFGTLKSDETKTLKVHIGNDGKEGLKGTLEPDNTWISTDPAKIDQDSMDVSITVTPVVGLLLNTRQVGYLQVVTNGGSQSIRCTFYYQETAIDDLPPELTITDPKDKTLTNKRDITVKGRTNPGVSVWVGSSQKEVKEDGSFEFPYNLHEGTNTITVTAKKDTGKTTEASIQVTVDSIAPSLTVHDPGSLVHSTPIWIEGATEKTATIRANGKNQKPDSNGNFKIMFDLKAGDNNLEIVAADDAGNVTTWNKTIKYVPQETITVKMWVGRPEAYVNENLIYLSVPPTIVNGRTFVPIRFVSENFKANVKWDPETRSVTVDGQNHSSTIFIDSMNAFLDGQPKKLDAAPFISKGSTLIPLRFIAEDTLSAKIDWDANEKRIELTLVIDIKTP